MRLNRNYLMIVVSILGMLITLIIAAVSFIKFYQYKNEMEQFINQEYWTRLHFARTLQELALIKADFYEAKEKGSVSSKLLRRMSFLNLRLKELFQLPYTDQFLSKDDKIALYKMQQFVETQFLPNIAGGTAQSQKLFLDLVSKMIGELSEKSKIIDNTVSDRRIWVHRQEQIRVNDFIYGGLFFFLIVFGFLCLTVFYILQYQRQRWYYSNKMKQFFQSVSNLFAQSTAPRLTGLHFFIQNLWEDRQVPEEALLVAALGRIKEVRLINRNLLLITGPHAIFKTEPLADLIGGIFQNEESHIKIEISPEAATQSVPAVQLQLILNEIVNNAHEFIQDKSKLEIILRGYLQKKYLALSKKLVLEVVMMNDGVGMTKEFVEKIFLPFFSMKGTSYPGLGLINCLKLIEAFHGEIKILSDLEKGVIIRIILPIKDKKTIIDRSLYPE